MFDKQGKILFTYICPIPLVFTINVCYNIKTLRKENISLKNNILRYIFMLIRFSVRNFLSFNDEIEMSMIPGKTRKHSNHITKDVAWNGINLLRIALVFGANASGKSNLVKAMNFAKTLIVDGTKPQQSIPVKCFKLNKSCADIPSKFEFEFKCHNEYYIYGFELDSKIIHKEWLYKTNAKSQKLIYERITTKDEKTSVVFDKKNTLKKNDKNFLNFVAMGTRANQLFLTESLQRNVKQFEDAYFWFKKVLSIVLPTGEDLGPRLLVGATDTTIKNIIKHIKNYDTGISDINLKPSNMESDLLDIPENLKKTLSDLEPNQDVVIHAPEGERFVVRVDKDKKVKMFRIMTKHKIKDSNEDILFDLDDESDGTLRILDLIPAILMMSKGEKVFVFDELDRSLHPNLSKMLIEQFLAQNPKTNSQMIVTTHETNLLDLDLLRRDEVWFSEKDDNGATSLYSLEEFSPRYDKDIRRGYILGRFGGIPLLKKNRDT
ncbi:MAG: AAA family ATPase [Dehalococcoidales bacterium]